MNEFHEPWCIQRCLEPHEDQHAITCSGGLVGRMFYLHAECLEERATVCVNALKDIPQHVIDSEDFKEAMRGFRLQRSENAMLRTAVEDIREMCHDAERKLIHAGSYEWKLRYQGRLRGLRAALTRLKLLPQIKDR